MRSTILIATCIFCATTSQASFASGVTCPGNASFDWEHVRRFVLVASNAHDFSDSQVRFLATSYDIVTVGNAHAQEQYEDNGAASVALARRIKAVNADVLVLLYWNSFIEYPFSASTRTDKQEHWYLHDRSGELYEPNTTLANRSLRRWDLSQADTRNWWVEQVVNTLAQGPLDGVFVDALPQVAGRPLEMAASVGEEKRRKLEAGLEAMLADLRDRMPEDAIILYNGLRDIPEGWKDGGMRFLEHTSGAFIEHFDFRGSSDKDRLANDIELMQHAAGMPNRITILKGWPGFSWLDDEYMALAAESREASARAAITFPLAAFLVGMGPCSYFSYSWGYREPMGYFLDYPQFDRRLGRPLDTAKRDGYSFTRRFEHAGVSINVETREARIDWL